MDALGELNDQTPRIRISEQSPPSPDIIFGLDTKLFEKKGDEEAFWKLKGEEGGWHGDEVETRTVWKGGVAGGGKRKRDQGNGHGHVHKADEEGVCGCEGDGVEGTSEAAGTVEPVEKEVLEESLRKLNFEIYRGESFIFVFVQGKQSVLRIDVRPHNTHPAQAYRTCLSCSARRSIACYCVLPDRLSKYQTLTHPQ